MQQQRRWLRGKGNCALWSRGISTLVLRRLGKGQVAGIGQTEAEEQRKPHGYWNKASTRKQFLDGLAKRLGVQSEEDWAFVTKRDICSGGGRALLTKHGSMEELLRAELGIVAEARSGVPSGYWEAEGHRLSLLRELAVKYAVERVSDWKRVSAEVVRRCRGGAAFLQRYHGSWAAALKANLEDDREVLQRMAEEGVLGRRWSAKGEWECPTKRKEFAGALAESLGLSRPEQWRNVTASDIKSHGGSGWLAHFGGSVTLAIQEVLQEGPYGGWAGHQLRPSVSWAHWTEESHVIAFIRSAEDALGLEEPAEWKRVGWRQLKELPGGRSFLKHANLLHALQLAHPAEDWQETEIKAAGKKASQHRMAALVRRLFPGASILEDHRHAMLDNQRGGPLLELDVYLPERKLAFEYNGAHHYEEIPFFGPLEAIHQRDLRKEELCKREGIRLVKVPYWWDNQLASLAASIEKAFPGVLAAEAARMSGQ